MNQNQFHLAQANVARMRAPLEDPSMEEFSANIAAINALAESTPGFVWRFQTEEGDATAVRPFDDEKILFNMSVWTSSEALFEYTYKTEHVRFLARRKEWFTHQEGPSLVLWWIPVGHIPTIEEALDRFSELEKNGPSPSAFSFGQQFSLEGLPFKSAR